MKAAILFPGQGAQHVGMGKELYENYSIAKEIFDKAASVLDWDIKEVCFEDKNGLINQTRYTQAALFTTNYAVYKVLEAEGIKAEAMLGFSLGEYDAIAASGSLDFENTLKLVDKRAMYMDACAAQNPGGMSAVIALKTEVIRQICKKAADETGKVVEVANDNCEGQVTVAGEEEGLRRAAELLKEAGAKRVIPLKVSGAFHSSLMKEASEKLSKELTGLEFSNPNVEVISNYTARPMDKEEIIKNIPLQIINGVRFRESIHYLLEQGFDTFIEAGPKCTLINLVKKMSSEVTLLQAEDSASLKTLIEKVGTTHA